MAKVATPSWADLIEDAQRPPDRNAAGRSDLSSPFGPPLPPDHRVVNDDPAQISGVPEYDYQAHVKHLILPTNENEYERILNDALSGKCIIRSEDKNFNKEGDFIVVVTYMTRTERPGRAQQPPRRRRRDENDQ